MKKKKIYFLTFGDIPFDQRMQRIWSSLNDAGYEISIFGRKLFDVPLDNYPFEIKRFTPVFRSGVLAYAEFNIRAVIYLIQNKPVCLCCIDLDTLLAGRFYKLIKRFTLIYDAHEYYTESPEIVGRPVIKFIWKKLADFCIPAVDLAYTVSQSIAKEMSLLYKVDFGVVRNLPLRYEIVDRKTSFNKPYILYQGALNVGRSLESLILSMSAEDQLILCIAGEGDLKDALISLVDSHDLEEKIIFLGNLPPDKLREVTGQAWLGINLLENLGKSYYLSLANKFFDYIQCGIPQICIDFPEYRSLNDEYRVAMLIDDISSANIFNSVKMLKEDELLYRTLVNNTIRAAGELNWEKESGKLTEIYQHIKF